MSIRRLGLVRCRRLSSSFDFRSHRLRVWNDLFRLPETTRMAQDAFGPSEASRALGARVNGRLADVRTPVQEDDVVESVAWDAQKDDARTLLWHSSAHLLGVAI